MRNLKILAMALLLAGCARAPGLPAGTATTTELEQRMQALPPTVRVRAGDRLAETPKFVVEMPDGSTPTVDLPALLKAQSKRAALLWFYQMDNTSW